MMRGKSGEDPGMAKVRFAGLRSGMGLIFE